MLSLISSQIKIQYKNWSVSGWSQTKLEPRLNESKSRVRPGMTGNPLYVSPSRRQAATTLANSV
jgi:hypothetical protein